MSSMNRFRFTRAQALEICRLRDQEGQSFSQIGHRLNAPSSTVRDTYHRTKRGGSVSQTDSPPTLEDSFDVDGSFEGVSIKSGVTAKSDGPNKMEVQSDPKKGGAWIYSIGQLINYCQIDMDVWALKKQEVKAYPGWRADKKVDLTWSDGRATGYVKDEGDISTRQLFSVYGVFVKRRPDSIFPHIQPVSPLTSYSLPEIPNSREEVYTSIISTDWQVGFMREDLGVTLTPFHDRRVLDILLQIVTDIQPDRIDLLGDLMDLPEWSNKFLKHPSFYWTTQPAINEASYWLTLLREASPGALMTVLEGNHDKRLTTATITHFPAAYGLSPSDMDLPVLSIPFLLSFDKLGIRWLGGYPDNHDRLGNVLLVHGNTVRSAPGDTAKAVAQSSKITVIYGHSHKLEYVGWNHDQVLAGSDDLLIEAFCPGTSSRIDYKTPGHHRGQIHRQGLAKLTYTLDGNYHITPIPIRHGVAMLDDKIYRARPDIIDGLSEAWPKWIWSDPTGEKEWWE